MASKYIQKFPIPGSFPDVLHDFVREVLRDQPENIYEYGAAYFTAMDEVSHCLSLKNTSFDRGCHCFMVTRMGSRFEKFFDLLR